MLRNSESNNTRKLKGWKEIREKMMTPEPSERWNSGGPRAA